MTKSLIHAKESVLQASREGGAGLVKLDVTSAEAFSSLPRGITCVIHTAAYIPYGELDEKKCEEVNVTGTKNVCKFCNEIGAKLVHSSSASVYDPTATMPVTEGSPLRPASFYGETKLEAERACLKEMKKGLNCTILRYSSVYGPGQNQLSVLPKFVQLAREGKELTVFGDGSRTQDFVFVGDIASANAAAVKKADGQTLNIGSGEPTKMIELARLVSEIFSSGKSKVVAKKDTKDSSPSFAMDITRARKVLGYSPTPLKEGLKQYRGGLA